MHASCPCQYKVKLHSYFATILMVLHPNSHDLELYHCKFTHSQNVVDSYQVALLMYCFQESLPASRPPPVAFSPPNAPPISAPLVGIFTFTIPQSLPWGLHNKRSKDHWIDNDTLYVIHFVAVWLKCFCHVSVELYWYIKLNRQHWIINKNKLLVLEKGIGTLVVAYR